MKIIKKLVLLFLLVLIPINSLAVASHYKDKVADIVNVKVDESKINLYLFHGRDCPHCAEEKVWLEDIKDKYEDNVNFYYYEVWYNEANAKLMDKVLSRLNIKKSAVPLTVIGEKYYVGYSKSTASSIENVIKSYIVNDQEDDEDSRYIPIIGNVNIKDVSIPLVAVILGFIDGFNPCAMWVLLFLINLLFGMKEKRKAWILGLTFLLISGLVYFLSMLGINLILGIATINWMKIIIAIFILIAGIFNFRKYLKIRKEETGCTVVDDKKRKNIIKKAGRIVNSKTFGLALIGIIVLAASVNLIEMACSLGFPVVFNEILTINNITGITRIIYLLIYILFYMIDDIVVFSISMITLEATGITNKYNKLCTLISAIIMIVMGLLMLFKPDWLMFNF
jgi:glutaredoxin